MGRFWDKEKYLNFALSRLHSLTDRTTDFGSVGEGSNPSVATIFTHYQLII